MRGLVTLATAFALPADFPQRETVVLAAFSVVLFTLIVQGATLSPLITLLHLDQTDTTRNELSKARARLAEAAIATLSGHNEPEAENLRFAFRLQHTAALAEAEPPPFARHRELGLSAILAERQALETMRVEDELGPDLYNQLQEQLDWQELTLLPDEARQIQQS